MDTEEFVSLKSIKSNKIDHEFTDEYNDLNNLNDLNKDDMHVFQVQGIENTSNGLIMKVGIMKQIHDILIKEFNIPPNFKCYMISRIYDMQTLKQTNDTGIIQMIKVNICHNNGTTLIPIASLCYNFNTTSHLQNKENIMNYISNNINKRELQGFYSITLHFKENGNSKYVNIQNQDTFSDKTQILIDLTKWLLDEKVKTILNKLI